MSAPSAGPPKSRTGRGATWVAAATTAASAAAALFAWLTIGADSALVGPALVATVLAVVGSMITGYGVSLTRPTSSARMSIGPLALLTAVAAVDGVIASMGTFVLASAVGSRDASTASIIVAVLGVTITICGLRLIRIVRARNTQPPSGS